MHKYKCGNEPMLGDLIERVDGVTYNIQVGDQRVVTGFARDGILGPDSDFSYDPAKFKLISRKPENKFAVKLSDGTMSNLSKNDALLMAEQSGVDCTVYELVPRYEFKAVVVTTTKMECTEVK